MTHKHHTRNLLKMAFASSLVLFLSGCFGGKTLKQEKAVENSPPSIAYVNFVLPNQIEWVQHINERNAQGAIVAEWGMKNYSQTDTPLRIIYNRVVPTNTPVNLLNQLIAPLKQGCTDITVTALPSPSKYSIQSGAEVICARLDKNNFGLLAKLYVFADKDAMHLVVSEVKTPPSQEAGILNARNEPEKRLVQNTQAAIAILSQFMQTIRVCSAKDQCV